MAWSFLIRRLQPGLRLIEPTAPGLIDHYEPRELASAAGPVLVDTKVGATAELIVRLADTADWQLTPAAAVALLVGI